MNFSVVAVTIVVVLRSVCAHTVSASGLCKLR